MGETLVFGLSVTVLGMVVVFAGLIILIFCVKALSALSRDKKKTAKQDADSPVASIEATSTSAPTAAGQDVSPEVLAAITAAIAVVWQSPSGFVVRHVKRIHNAPAWNRAGREEQTYSRF